MGSGPHRRLAFGLRLAGRIARRVIPEGTKGIALLRRLSNPRRERAPLRVRSRTLYLASRDPDRTIRVRLFARQGRADVLESIMAAPDKALIPIVLYLHGGGYVMGSPDAEQAYIRAILRTRDCIVAAPDYRLAPEHPYPAAIQDCDDLLEWAAQRGRVGIVGVSAGGGLALGVTLRDRDRGAGRVGFCAPLYPMIDCRMESESMVGNRAPMWNEGHSRIAWPMYLPDGVTTREVEYASPSLAEELRGLPPLFSFVGRADPFLSETVEFFGRAREAGVDATVETYEGAFHAFEVVSPLAPISIHARAWFREQLATHIDRIAHTSR